MSPRASKRRKTADKTSTPPPNPELRRSPRKHASTSNGTSTPRTRTAPAASGSPVPTRKRRGGQARRPDDDEVWDWEDSKIIGIDKQFRRSTSDSVYEHYVDPPVLERKDGKIVYVFTCKHNPSVKVRRRRSDTSTSNLNSHANGCSGEHDRQEKITGFIPATYNALRHRLYVSLWSATSNRPHSIVTDDYYQKQMRMCGPNVKFPSARTISRDLIKLHHALSEKVAEKLQAAPSAMHIGIDGWTAPMKFGFLGVLAFWHANGVLHKCVLDFIRLTDGHTGKYLGGKLYDVLVRFGIDDKTLALVLDNAANNGTTVAELANRCVTFRGEKSRSRCFAHIGNLIAKAFLSVFYPKATRKKGTGDNTTASTATGTSQSGNSRGAASAGTKRTVTVMEEDDEDEEVSDEAAEAMAEVDDDREHQDEDDIECAASDALREAADWGIFLTDAERKEAARSMHLSVTLATRILNSPVLAEAFKKLCQTDDTVTKDVTRPIARCPTRWNSDRANSRRSLDTRGPIETMTAQSQYKLQAYRFEDVHWNILKQMQGILKLFDDLTLLFSQKNTPLVAHVVPVIEYIESALDKLVNDDNKHMAIRFAAYLAGKLLGKYYAYTDDTEVYRIAMYLHPCIKDDYFGVRSHWSEEDKAEALSILRNRWEESYKGEGRSTGSDEEASDNSEDEFSLAKMAPRPASGLLDELDVYLATPKPPQDALKFDVLGWWVANSKAYPRLSRMALDYLSIPATSVDVERAFSKGRLTVTHLRHNMSSASFRASQAIGSWIRDGLFDDEEIYTVFRTLVKNKEVDPIEDVVTAAGTEGNAIVVD